MIEKISNASPHLIADFEYFPSHIDPGTNMTNSGWYILNNVSITLFDMAEDQSLKGLLAESWEKLDNGKVFRVKIRDDAFFHDGSPITSKDVVFSLKRKSILWPDYELFHWLDPQDKNSIKAINERTIEFRLKRSYDFFLFILALPGTGIVPSHLYSMDKPNDVRKNPILGGAYQIEEWRKGQYLKLRLFEKWFGDKTNIPSRITINEIDDAQKIFNRFINGESNYLMDIQRKAFTYFIKNPQELKIFNQFNPVLNTTTIVYFNCLSGPLKNTELRKAFAAVLWRANANLTGELKREMANEFYPPGYSGRTGARPLPQIENYQHVYKKLKEKPIELSYMTVQGITNQRTEIVNRFCMEHGFKIKIHYVSYPELKTNRLQNKDFDFGMHAIPVPPGDPTLVFRLDFGPDDVYIADPNDNQFYKMTAQATENGSWESLVNWAKKINNYINETVIFLPLAYRNFPFYSTKNFDLSGLPKWDFNTRFYHVRTTENKTQ